MTSPRTGSAGWLLLVLLLLAPHAVWSMDKVKAAAATAQQAASALQRGDHKQAAHLYLEAYKLDPAMSDYLYGAARESQAVGDADRAEELYGQYLALTGTDAKRTENARKFVGELRADAKAREAEVMRARGDGALAAQLYREAWTLDGTRLVFLVRGARAAQDSPIAVELLELFLSHAAPTDPDRAEAKARLELLRAKAPAAPPTRPASAPAVEPEAAHPAAVVAPKPVESIAVGHATEARSRTPAWISLGSGGALIAAGIGIWASTLSDRSALEAALAQRDNGLISGVSLADAQSRNRAIVNRNIAAGIVGGVGVAAVGVGLWLWFSGSESRVALSASGSGAVLVGRW